MTPEHRPEPPELLVVEDNPGDVRLLREALEGSDLDGSITVVTDGEAALDYLGQCGDSDSADSSTDLALVILDLNLPKVNGAAVLEAIRSDPRLRSIPVVVLSSSKSEEDIRETNDLGADGYHVKPIDPNEYMSLVRSIAASVSDTGRPPPGAYSATDSGE